MGINPQIRQQKATIIKEIWRNMKLGIVASAVLFIYL